MFLCKITLCDPVGTMETSVYVRVIPQNCTGGPSLEYEYLFYIVSVICSPNIMTCNGKRDTSIVTDVYESSNKLI